MPLNTTKANTCFNNLCKALDTIQTPLEYTVDLPVSKAFDTIDLKIL